MMEMTCGLKLLGLVQATSWNPDGISIATEFSNSKAILDAVDDLALRFNKEVGLLSSFYYVPWLLSHLAHVCYLHFPL